MWGAAHERRCSHVVTGAGGRRVQRKNGTALGLPNKFFVSVRPWHRPALPHVNNSRGQRAIDVNAGARSARFDGVWRCSRGPRCVPRHRGGPAVLALAADGGFTTAATTYGAWDELHEGAVFPSARCHAEAAPGTVLKRKGASGSVEGVALRRRSATVRTVAAVTQNDRGAHGDPALAHGRPSPRVELSGAPRRGGHRKIAWRRCRGKQRHAAARRKHHLN